MGQDQRVAVVAGGSAGAGRAVVSRLVEKGYRVGVLARGRERLEELEQLYGDRVYCLSCDVADAPAVARAGATIEEVLGPVDVWVNMAMLTSFSPFMSMEAEEFEQIRRRHPSRRRQRHPHRPVADGTAQPGPDRDGRGPASHTGRSPTSPPYCAAKHGINGFMSSIRSELIREGSEITVGLVQLPALDTPQFGWALNRLSKAAPAPRRRSSAPMFAARAILTRHLRRKAGVLRGALGAPTRLPPTWRCRTGWTGRWPTAASKCRNRTATSRAGGRTISRPRSRTSPPGRRGASGTGPADRAIIVDADRARMIVLGALPLSGLLVGLLLG